MTEYLDYPDEQLTLKPKENDKEEPSNKETEGDGSIFQQLDENKERLTELIGYEDSFDVLFREMTYGDKKVGILYLNGFTNDVVLTEVVSRLTYLEEDQLEPQTRCALC